MIIAMLRRQAGRRAGRQAGRQAGSDNVKNSHIEEQLG